MHWQQCVILVPERIWVESGMVDDNIRIEGMKVSFSLIFEKPTDPFMKSVIKSAEAAILTYVSKEVEIAGNISVGYRTNSTS